MSPLKWVWIPAFLCVASFVHAQSLSLMTEEPTARAGELAPSVADETPLESLKLLGELAYRAGEDTLSPKVDFHGGESGAFTADNNWRWKYDVVVAIQSPLQSGSPQEIADQFALSGGNMEARLQGRTDVGPTNGVQAILSAGLSASWLNADELTAQASTNDAVVGARNDDVSAGVWGGRVSAGLCLRQFYVGWQYGADYEFTDSNSEAADLIDGESSHQIRFIAKLQDFYLQATYLPSSDSDREFTVGLATEFNPF